MTKHWELAVEVRRGLVSQCREVDASVGSEVSKEIRLAAGIANQHHSVRRSRYALAQQLKDSKQLLYVANLDRIRRTQHPTEDFGVNRHRSAVGQSASSTDL